MRAHSAVHQVTRGVTGAKKILGTGAPVGRFVDAVVAGVRTFRERDDADNLAVVRVRGSLTGPAASRSASGFRARAPKEVSERNAPYPNSHARSRTLADLRKASVPAPY
jgi:hypothetical protein